MQKILVTGATGNIGMEVISWLYKLPTNYKVTAGVRNPDKAKSTFSEYPHLEYTQFDFENPDTFLNALKGITTVFLLRPPHISDVEKYFAPLVLQMQNAGIRQVVFLSVQGAEKSKVIPHNKIERLLEESGMEYVFLRPSYFMQNLTSTLKKDIQEKREIILPSGKAKLNWIDAANIGEVAAITLENFSQYKNQKIEITGDENLNFYEVVDVINQNSKASIAYKPVNPISFYFIKKKDGVPTGMIMVMIMLHFLPRFQKDPQRSDAYNKITGKKPNPLSVFVEREKDFFNKSADGN